MNALLIEDHPLMLFALQTVLQGLADEVNLTCVETAGAARDRLAANPRFDLALLDLELGDVGAFDLLVELRRSHPAVAIVVISSSVANEDVARAIHLGAMGYVPKRASVEVLFQALKLVLSGGIYVPPVGVRAPGRHSALAENDRDGWRVPVDAKAAELPARPTFASLGLTPRQTAVLELLLEGRSNKHIARELNRSVETVKDHVAAVLRTLKVSSRTQAVLAVNEMTARAAFTPRQEAPPSEARP